MSGEDRPIYEIRVEGRLQGCWSDWFGGLAITCEGEGSEHPVTILSGPLADQATLRGVLARIWDLNLTLLSLTRRAHRRTDGADSALTIGR